MTTYLPPFAAFDRAGRSRWIALLAGLWLIVFALHAAAQAPAAATGAAPPPAANAMDDLVGRIALYPDDLVAIILPASTSPLQIVQADRYLDKRKTDPKLPLDDKWDDAVKTLLNYPEVVKMMSNDLDWTSALGEAVVADQGAVLEGVQSFRRRAQAAGNLKSDDKQVVKAEQGNHHHRAGQSRGDLCAAVHPEHRDYLWRGAGLRLLPGAVPFVLLPLSARGRTGCGRDLGRGDRRGLEWRPLGCQLWRRRHQHRYRPQHQHQPRRPWQCRGAAAGWRSGSTAWKSNKQPGQVSSSVGKTSMASRPGDARSAGGGYGSAGAGGARPSTQPGGGAAGAGGRPSAQPGAGAGGRPAAQPGAGAGGAGVSRPGTQPAAGGSANRGGDAFGGYSSGRQAQMDSSRGASSRGSMSGGGARPMPSGGGARGGGGGRGGGGRR